MEGKMVNVKENNSNGIVIILKGTLISIIATIVLLMIFAVVLTYSNINENSMPTVIIVVTALCILVGSQITTSKIKRNGIVNGALVGAIYILALYLISSIISKDFSLNIYSIIMMATSILIGGIGGIIGVNKK
jgi:putative membrane protein (TIGR04086 family)